MFIKFTTDDIERANNRLDTVLERAGVEKIGRWTSTSGKFRFNSDKYGWYIGRDGKKRWTNFDTMGTGDAVQFVMEAFGISSFQEAVLFLLDGERPCDLSTHGESHEDNNRHMSSSSDINAMEEIRRANLNRIAVELSESKRSDVVRTLLNERGIEYDILPSFIQKKISYVSTQLRVLDDSRSYDVDGICFSLGTNINPSYKIRRCVKNGHLYQYAPKDSRFRFINVGAAHLFAPESLSEKGPVVITEGEMDCLSVFSCGYPATSIPGVSNLSLLLHHLDSIELDSDTALILALDNDKAGQKALAELWPQVRSRGIKYSVFNAFHGYKDLNDLLMHDSETLRYELRKIMEPTIGIDMCRQMS